MPQTLVKNLHAKFLYGIADHVVCEGLKYSGEERNACGDEQEPDRLFDQFIAICIAGIEGELIYDLSEDDGIDELKDLRNRRKQHGKEDPFALRTQVLPDDFHVFILALLREQDLFYAVQDFVHRIAVVIVQQDHGDARLKISPNLCMVPRVIACVRNHFTSGCICADHPAKAIG